MTSATLSRSGAVIVAAKDVVVTELRCGMTMEPRRIRGTERERWRRRLHRSDSRLAGPLHGAQVLPVPVQAAVHQLAATLHVGCIGIVQAVLDTIGIVKPVVLELAGMWVASQAGASAEADQ